MTVTNNFYVVSQNYYQYNRKLLEEIKLLN